MEAAEEQALRAAVDEIRRYRAEWADHMRQEIESDVRKMEAEGFDPARGRGRGPKWAEGGAS